jgi:tetratricopeptide (TPR) repeat protein
MFYHGDKKNKAATLLQESITIRKTNKNKNFPLSKAYAEFGIYCIIKGNYQEGTSYLLKALSCYPNKYSAIYVSILKDLAYGYFNMQKYANALKYAQKAYSLSLDIYKSNNHIMVEECKELLDSIKEYRIKRTK